MVKAENAVVNVADVREALQRVWEHQRTMPTLCLHPDCSLTFSLNFPIKVAYSDLVEPGQVWIISNPPPPERPAVRRIVGL